VRINTEHALHQLITNLILSSAKMQAIFLLVTKISSNSTKSCL